MPSPDRGLVAIIEDDPVMGESLVQRLELEGYAVNWWRSGGQALEGLKTIEPDAIVCDIRLPDMDGEQVFSTMPPQFERVPVMFVTAFGQIEQAVRLTKAGAADYIAKPFALGDFLERIEGMVAQRSLGGTDVLGNSKPMREIATTLARVAAIDSTVLLTGESGVGKEVAARYLHSISPRRSAPFIAVNCAAIPKDLLENEIFGHEKGAFTGASGKHEGYVERARDGFLFLDEIGDLPMSMQTKLLRLIESRAYTRLGGERELLSTARIVCATNVDLSRAVAEGTFRADLYYRINVIPMQIPPLRERREDILPLAKAFLSEFATTFGRCTHGFAGSTEQALLGWGWPGNVRELRNRIERAVALTDAAYLRPEAVFPERGPGAAEGDISTLAEVRQNAERDHIRSALERTGGRVEEAAKILGVSRSTLFDKLKKLGIAAEA